MNLADKYQKISQLTYEDYLAYVENLPENLRAEWYDAYIVDLVQPRIQHQRIAKRLLTKWDLFLSGKTCEVHQEVECDLFADQSHIVIPDLLVNCKPERETEFRIEGAPDLVVEILSPSTASRDYVFKRRLYQKAGVKEYWIVDPEGFVTVYDWLDTGHDDAYVLEEGDTVARSKLFPDFELSLLELFVENSQAENLD